MGIELRDDQPWPPETPGALSEARFLVEKLIELEPDSPLNPERQFVLDNWPTFRPVFSPEIVAISLSEIAEAVNNGDLRAEIDAANGFDPDLEV